MSKHLRLFRGDGEKNNVFASKKSKCETITVKLGDVLGALKDAQSKQRLWLRDFSEEEITISTDLYDVILAYDGFRKTSA